MASTQFDARPRSQSILSSESKKTHKSRKSSSSNKLDLTESSKDKRRISGKADPNMATNEMQPSAMALEKPTLDNLRTVSFTGRDGQIINEPDSSNPTRNRWESPLQTIRGFEEDVDRTYREKRVTSPEPNRPQSRADMYGRGASRRSSYFGSNVGGYNQGPQNGGYYRGYDNGEEMQTNQQYNGYNPRLNRNQSEPMMGMNGNQPAYNQQPYHQYQGSRDTVTPSPDTDHFGVSTGPSSFNSSADQVGYPHGQQNGYAAPPPPPQAQPAPRAPMKLNTGVDTHFDIPTGKDKRQSWFKRRFSKD